LAVPNQTSSFAGGYWLQPALMLNAVLVMGGSALA